MPKKWTHAEAFKHFGATPRNIQWSWSARSADGKTVVVTLWQDEFKRQDGRLIYEVPGRSDTRPGFKELMENLAWARDHCDGRFNAIIARARDPSAEPRSIRDCEPKKGTMRLTRLDQESGAWAAEVEGM